MECFQTSRSSTSSVFENNELVYIHCVSKKNFNVTLKGFTCILLICREIHVSFVDALDERRRALVPVTVENSAVDDLFAGVSVKLSGVGYLTLAVFPYGTAVEGYVQPCSLVASYSPWKRRYVVAFCLRPRIFLKTEIILSFSKRYASTHSVFEPFSPVHTKTEIK